VTQFYSDPSRESDPYSLPDCEVFYYRESEAWILDGDGEPMPNGWYYRFCFPGSMPESDPIGPYGAEQDAIEACRDFCAD
jgi:hypothetical protein